MSDTFGELRNLEKEKAKAGNGSSSMMEMIKNLPTTVQESSYYQSAVAWSQSGWNASRRTVWFIATFGIITLVPMSIELLREEQSNEAVKELLSKGFNYQQIQAMGFPVTQPQSTLSSDPSTSTH